MGQEVAQTAGIGLDGGGVRRIALAVDMVIGQVVEFIGALLVLAETGILFAGVVSRYLFNSPIIWTDELATFLFLWLAMIGAVVALRRDGHMRLTTFVSWVGPQWGGWLATLASLILIVFVLEILVPAQQFLEVQRSTELITLHISDGYRVVAILVGAGLIAAVALLRLLETTTWVPFLLALALIGGIASGLWLAQPLLAEMGRASLILFFVVIVAACVFIGAPIAFAFGIATFSYLALTTSMPLEIVVNRMDDGISNLLLLAVPMFVFLGLLMEMTGSRELWSRSLRPWSDMCAAGSPMCCWGRCTSCRASPARRPPTWPRWRRSSFPRCRSAACIRASCRRCWRRRARCRRPSRRAWC